MALVKKNLEQHLTQMNGNDVICPLDVSSCIDGLTKINSNISLLKENVPYILSYKKLSLQSNTNHEKIIYLEEIVGKSKYSFQIPLQEKLTDREQDFYNNLFSNKNLKISIFFGYFDHGNETFNYHAELMSREIIKFFLKMNGFKVIEESSTFTLASLNMENRKKIMVKIFHSFFACKSEVEKINQLSTVFWGKERTTYLPLTGLSYTFKRHFCQKQEDHSRFIKEKFLKSIKDDDIVIYSGHSRHGRGPDFGRRYSKSGSINKDTLTSMSLNSSNLKVLYFNGCSGKKNYPSLVRSFPNDRRLIAWNDNAPEFTDSFFNLTMFLQALLEKRAIEDIEKRINRLRRTNIWPSTVKLNGIY
jgi:hypothetical protein